MVYNYIFTDKTYDLDLPGHDIKTPATWHGFISACRQINAETASLPYTLNAFRASLVCNPDFRHFLACLTLKRQSVPVLRLTSETHSILRYFVENPIKGFQGIKRVEFVIQIHVRDAAERQMYVNTASKYASRVTSMRSWQFEVFESFFGGECEFGAMYVRVERD